MPGLVARRNGFPWFRPVHPRRRLLVRMDTTNHCNLRCSMCPMRLSEGDANRNWRHMDRDTFRRIEEEVFPLAKTVGISCGAEPLVNPSFPEHLKALYESGVPYREMVTNGTLLTPETIRTILMYPPTSLFISIDGASRDTHGAIRDGASLDGIIRSLEILVDQRGKRRFPMLGFSTTLQRDNLHELAGIVELARSVGARSVGVVPLVPYAGLGTLHRVVDPDSPEASSEILKARKRAGEMGITFHLSRNVSRGDTPHPCPYLQGTVFIDPHGSIFPCPYWNTGNPLGSMDMGFMNVWNGDVYRRLRRGDFIGTDNCLNCPEITRGKMEVSKDRQ